MKLIIAGGRDYQPNKEAFTLLNAVMATYKITEIVSGGATGADIWGEIQAEKHGLPVKIFPANWSKFGKAAGPVRNREMARYADILFALPGGKGTQNMVNEAKAEGLIIIRRY